MCYILMIEDIIFMRELVSIFLIFLEAVALAYFLLLLGFLFGLMMLIRAGVGVIGFLWIFKKLVSSGDLSYRHYFFLKVLRLSVNFFGDSSPSYVHEPSDFWRLPLNTMSFITDTQNVVANKFLLYKVIKKVLQVGYKTLLRNCVKSYDARQPYMEIFVRP